MSSCYCTHTSFPIFCYSSCVLHSSCFTNSPINVFANISFFFSGLRNRQVGSHLMNDHSSRSHSMLTVYIDIESVSTTPSSTYVNRSVRTWVFFDLENKVWQTRGRCLGSGKVIIAWQVRRESSCGASKCIHEDIIIRIMIVPLNE